VIFCAISASWLYWAIRTKINCNGPGYQRRRPPTNECTRPAERDQLSSAPAGAARQVCPLPTTIALSYLTL
jgi:hypothetical protein